MMSTVHLHGHLAEFGGPYKFDVRTAGEALRALNCAFPGKFVKALEAGSYQVVRGNLGTGYALDLDEVNSFNLGGELHILPVIEGAADTKGIAKTIIGVALIGGAIFMSGGTLAAPLTIGSLTVPGATWGTVAVLGLGIALAGASTLLAKPEKTTEKTDSYTINGPGNTAEQGAAVPLVYGEVITGSVGVSFDADIEDIGAWRDVDYYSQYQAGYRVTGAYPS